ncbi:hypothetical protein DK926_04975 [Rhodococcus sp. Eu-32]|uniref:hypothetical protein n=1 Tax=Rhodococcus sp. Eu-32 TaxID=1017319 RepID=UPI000DF438CC|nr:hypothetical protein [Rhodococcus sp. Eu-32]RRQ29236.1 hypothetical protein DK926_04975 [Rhodococcus sp. Eu-32]
MGGIAACSPTGEIDSPQSNALVRPTQFAAAPEPVNDPEPTPEQLTVLFRASYDYSIREEDRARLIEGPSDGNLSLAREWGAQHDPQQVEFISAVPVGPDAVEASGQATFLGAEPYPVGPIPFVRSDGEWKVSRTFVCGMMGLSAAQHLCQ